MDPLTENWAPRLESLRDRDEEHQLIANAARLTDLIGSRPLQKLAPYAGQIEELASAACRLSSMVLSGRSSSPDDERYRTMEEPNTRREAQSPAGATSVTSNRDGAPKQRKSKAADLLSAIMRDCQALGEDLKGNMMIMDWLAPSERIAHLAPIFFFQGRSPNRPVTIHDQLLLASSCVSLAEDFASYEAKHGWEPKLDVLSARILAGEEPACQAIGKHAQSFIASQTPVLAHQQKIDAAIRQGTKLLVLERVGHQLGFGNGLGLLASFQSRKLLRLSYKDFAEIIDLLASDMRLYQPIAFFCREYGAWWVQCCACYHSKHGTH